MANTEVITYGIKNFSSKPSNEPVPARSYTYLAELSKVNPNRNQKVSLSLQSGWFWLRCRSKSHDQTGR